MKRLFSYAHWPLLTVLMLSGSQFRPETSLIPDGPALPYAPVCGETHVGGIPRSLLTQSVALRTGLGATSIPTSTTNPQAQAYFEQGMAYLHGYSLVEAARSFHEALRHDPTLAMAQVGLNRVYIQADDFGAARKAAEAARSLEKDVSEREKVHIALRFAQQTAVESPKNGALLDNYRNQLEEATRRFPDDAELWLLAGNAQERVATGRGQGSSKKGIEIYETILKTTEHPAAHHYLIHAYEGIGEYEKAKAHGAAYARLSPRLAHAQHMYAHDLMKTGEVEEAIFKLTTADSLERQLYLSDNYKAEFDWHHSHNISVLALCYQYQGRMQEAEALAREKFHMPRPVSPERTFYNRMSLPELLIAQRREAEALPLTETMQRAKTPGERLMGHFFEGIIHLKTNDLAQARASLKASEAEMDVVREKHPTGWMISWLEPYPEYLSALIALTDPATRDKGMKSVRAFQQKAHKQFGPDPWIEALFQLETIADLAYQLQLTDLFEESAKLLAAHDPAYPGTHLALARLADGKGDRATAEREWFLAGQGWAKADEPFAAQRLKN